MVELVWTVPALPLAGFILLVLGGNAWPRRAVKFIGVGSVGLSAVSAAAVFAGYILSPFNGQGYSQTLWTWMEVSRLAPTVGLHVDELSLVMVMVVTVVGFLIHLYAVDYMIDDPGFRRFFAYMNLFVASMLTLVLADNLLLLYLGWEGVGLCSYLLIGFWYEDEANGRAARKAFLVTRIGDTAMAVGLLLLYSRLGTLNVQDVMDRASDQWAIGSAAAVAAASLLLVGALGKSAQLPLQTWLPDAMAGPTPVSALIHAATMVTAGVYLIARTHVLFALAPALQWSVAWLGAATLLGAACSALVQRDIKRVLAYSTMSQVGYMFLALGVGAWSAGVFHLVTHAFFKALLFLSAGVVIASLHHERDIFKMGGLRLHLPLTFWSFVIGAAALSGVPWITSGFYSKEWILSAAWAASSGGRWLWAAGWAGAFLTALYSFRLVFVVFWGETRQSPERYAPGVAIIVPLVALAAGSLLVGFLQPSPVESAGWFGRWMKESLPPTRPAEGSTGELVLPLAAAAISLLGIYGAYLLYVRRPPFAQRLTGSHPVRLVGRWWSDGWGFDAFYDRLFVRPFIWAARLNEADFIDSLYAGLAELHRKGHEILRRTQTGRLRWYAAVLTAGSLVLVTVTVFFS